jgi:hypothetical protein
LDIGDVGKSIEIEPLKHQARADAQSNNGQYDKKAA